ncbi:MAG: hypothetical protein ACD_73C00373G0001 [uncultured bacterium]|nr:MAG: hypothetical protein ACD_73C00373G0001 [uncultured bacterium]
MINTTGCGCSTYCIRDGDIRSRGCIRINGNGNKPYSFSNRLGGRAKIDSTLHLKIIGCRPGTFQPTIIPKLDAPVISGFVSKSCSHTISRTIVIGIVIFDIDTASIFADIGECGPCATTGIIGIPFGCS